MGCPSLVLQLLSCGFVAVLSSSAFVVSDSPVILIICVTFHCLIILLMLGALIGNKEFVSCILYKTRCQNSEINHVIVALKFYHFTFSLKLVHVLSTPTQTHIISLFYLYIVQRQVLEAWHLMSFDTLFKKGVSRQ